MGLATKAGEGFVSSLLNNLSTSYDDIAKEIAKGIGKSADNFEIPKVGDAITKEIADNVAKKNFSNNITKVANSGIPEKEKFDFIRKQHEERYGTIAGNALFAGRTAKAYMMEDGKKAYRWGTYGAVMLGGRIISGGTPLHNNTGERDIAGIPFI